MGIGPRTAREFQCSGEDCRNGGGNSSDQQSGGKGRQLADSDLEECKSLTKFLTCTRQFFGTFEKFCTGRYSSHDTRQKISRKIILSRNKVMVGQKKL